MKRCNKFVNRLLPNESFDVYLTFYQVSQDLRAIRNEPENDIVTEARENDQKPETEILLYDVYVS